MEIKLNDGSICDDKDIVINKWKYDFEEMLNKNSDTSISNEIENCNSDIICDEILDGEITSSEVYNVVKISKCGKSPGVDDIPVELYKNPTALNALIRVFNICYNSGKVPAMWNKCIITPIPKSSTADPRDPMSYRGISLAPVAYKLYCGVLNARLTGKLTELEVINDEQNGFRKSRSTIDHLSTLTTIIETRKLCKLSTFCAFVDFKKAYDWVNRNLLFSKLESLGLSTKISTVHDLSYEIMPICYGTKTCKDRFSRDGFLVKTCKGRDVRLK
ncbi:unnamed protein product [Mytilus edulis]|uniref:Reverse transcriptase domain-containing protein n=1 Tax=Mytilus edulis TaxID=6550 RepID=A0A8S3S8I2_MYTED|nr:unnamed protein product [Mytilus edulis]